VSVTEMIAPLAQEALGREAPMAVRGWDGSHCGPADASWLLKLNNRRGVRRLLWAPNELGFARAYFCGDIEIEGDVFDVLSALMTRRTPVHGRAAIPPPPGPGIRPCRDPRMASQSRPVRIAELRVAAAAKICRKCRCLHKRSDWLCRCPS
jgi:hypothetical protein